MFQTILGYSCILQNKYITIFIRMVMSSIFIWGHITFRLGKQQGKVDTLSWRSYLTIHPSDLAFDNKKYVILGPRRLQATIVFDNPLDSSIVDTIHHYLKIDVFVQDILDHIDTTRASCSQSQH